MDKIFGFIFECLRGIFNFLDFKLPNINLTYVDFLIVVPIIVVIFKLVKGAVGESGDGILFGGMNSISNSIGNYSSLSYKNFIINKQRSLINRQNYVINKSVDAMSKDSNTIFNLTSERLSDKYDL